MACPAPQHGRTLDLDPSGDAADQPAERPSAGRARRGRIRKGSRPEFAPPADGRARRALRRDREIQGKAGDRRVRGRQSLGQGCCGPAQAGVRPGFLAERGDRGLAAGGAAFGEVMAGTNLEGSPMNDSSQPTFSIEKIYVKDLSLEVPGGPQAFMRQEQPQLEVQITQQSERVSEVLIEVTLVVTVTAKSGEKVLFLVEASQAGVFQIRNVAEPDLPPLLLAPVNFESIYQQRVAAATKPDEPRIEVAH